MKEIVYMSTGGFDYEFFSGDYKGRIYRLNQTPAKYWWVVFKNHSRVESKHTNSLESAKTEIEKFLEQN